MFKKSASTLVFIENRFVFRLGIVKSQVGYAERDIQQRPDVKQLRQELLKDAIKRRELAKVTILLDRIENIKKDIEAGNDVEWARLMVPWIGEQIESLRKLGGNESDVRKLREHQTFFKNLVARAEQVQLANQESQELAKVPQLLALARTRTEEIEASNDVAWAGEMVPWLERQIIAVRALGGSEQDINQLLKYQAALKKLIDPAGQTQLAQESGTESDPGGDGLEGQPEILVSPEVDVQSGELVKVRKLLTLVQTRTEEIEASNDAEWARVTLDWLSEQITSVRTLGGSPTDISRLVGYQADLQKLIDPAGQTQLAQESGTESDPGGDDLEGQPEILVSPEVLAQSGELAKVRKLLSLVEKRTEEIEASGDVAWAGEMVSWLERQIIAVRSLGGSEQDISQLLRYQSALKKLIDPAGQTQLAGQDLQSVKQRQNNPVTRIQQPGMVEKHIDTLPLKTREVLTALDFRNIESLNLGEVEVYLNQLKEDLKNNNVSIETIIQRIIPSNNYSLTLFYSDEFRSEFAAKLKELAGRTDNYANKVREILLCCQDAKANQEKHHFVFKKFAEIFGQEIDWREKQFLFSKGDSISIPKDHELANNHQGAIDIFFNVVRESDKEIGPDIRAYASGIVIAAAGDWEGGATETSYAGGGLSPTSGNGVVIFNPMTSQYYYYVHCYDLNVERGDIVQAGDVLGRGGNTGKNAARRGGGKHLHFEIHDYSNGSNLAKNCYLLRRMILAARDESTMYASN